MFIRINLEIERFKLLKAGGKKKEELYIAASSLTHISNHLTGKLDEF